MVKYEIVQIKNLLDFDLDHLLKQSKEEEYRFVERLVNDYKNGSNTFNQGGEGLFGAFNEAGVLIAVGGLNKDPYSNERLIGRVRRFYVSREYRRIGIGSLLIKRIIDEAKKKYKVLVLHTDTVKADQFYISIGFLKGTLYLNSTHYMEFNSSCNCKKSKGEIFMNNVTKMKIFKPVNELFEAFADPSKIGNFWFSSSSARWEQGKTITLRYDEYDAQGDIKITEIKLNKKIVFHWGANGEGNKVTIILNDLGSSESMIEITEEGFNENDDNLLFQMLDNKEGWVYMLTCLKGYLEYGVNLRASLVK